MGSGGHEHGSDVRTSLAARGCRGRRGAMRRCGTVVLALLLGALAAPSAASADAVVDWNATMGRLTSSLRTHAIVHLAIHDTLNAIDRRFEPYAVDVRGQGHEVPEAAVAAAAHYALARLLPPVQREANDAAYVSALSGVPDGPPKDRAIALGEQVAERIVRLRVGDGFGQPYTYFGGDAPGAWRPTPPAFSAGLGTDQARAKPFILASAGQFGLEGPPDLTSETYTRDFEEVREVGRASSASRTGEQTSIARAWGASTIVLADLWLRAVAVQQRLDPWQSARLFALAIASGVDAGIATFHYKYVYGFWRPVTAIRLADDDGNPATAAERGWTPLLDTPAFPEYPSGHCAGTAAVVEAVTDVIGTTAVALRFVSPALPGFSRPITDLRQLNEDCIDARVWAGIHFRTSDRAAASLGRRIAQFASHHALRAMPGHVRTGPWRGGDAHQDDPVDARDDVE